LLKQVLLEEAMLVFISKAPKYTDTLVLWWEKDNEFSDKPLLKAARLSRALLSECNTGIFYEMGKKSISMPQSLPVSEKEVKHSLAIHEAGLGGCLPRSSWCFGLSGCKKYILKVLLQDGGLYAQVLSVQKTWWTYSREWVRSVHFNKRIVTINCYFYFWEDICQGMWSGNGMHAVLRQWATVHFRRIQTIDCQI